MTTLEIALLVIQVIAMPLVLYHGMYAKAGIGEKPLILDSVIVQFVMNIAILVLLGATIWFLFLDWKIALIGFVGSGLGWKYVVFPIIRAIDR